MKFEINCKEFAEVLDCVADASTERHIIPILTTVKLDITSDGVLKVTCSNDNLFLSILKVVGGVTEAGSVCIPAKKLKTIIKTMVAFEGNITVESVGTNAVIKGNKSKFKLSGFDAEEFPSMPINSSKKILVWGKTLIELLDTVSSCIEQVEGRHHLAGANCTITSNSLLFAGTDSKSLVVASREVEVEDIDLESFTIPLGMFKLIKKNFNMEDHITIGHNDGYVFFDSGNVFFAGRKIGNDFPDWQMVKEQTESKIKDKGYAELNKQDIVNALNGVDTTSGMYSKAIITAGINLEITSESDVGDSSVIVEGNFVGDIKEAISVKSTRTASIINSLPVDKVKLYIAENMLVVKGIDDSISLWAVIMGMR